MDLNHLELSPFLVVDLYPSSLIEEPVEPVVKASPLKEELPVADPIEEQWLGGNGKNILIVLSNSGAAQLPARELQFLKGILTACLLTLPDVAIVNVDYYPLATYKELIATFKSKVVLLFAIEPEAFGLPMSFPPFQIQPFSGTSFLYSPSLKELEKDKLLKSKLWVSLKRLFNL